MSSTNWQDGVLREQWDDATRTYSRWSAAGVLETTRPYDAKENEIADAIIAGNAANANQRTIEQTLALRMDTMQAIIDDTNANINTNPAARIKDIARAVRLLIRMELENYDGTA